MAQAPERKEWKQLENKAAAQWLEQQDREARLREWEREIILRERQAEARFETFDLAVARALPLVELLNPGADPQTKAMAARALVPQLLVFVGQWRAWRSRCWMDQFLPNRLHPRQAPPHLYGK